MIRAKRPQMQTAPLMAPRGKSYMLDLPALTKEPAVGIEPTTARNQQQSAGACGRFALIDVASRFRASSMPERSTKRPRKTPANVGQARHLSPRLLLALVGQP